MSEPDAETPRQAANRKRREQAEVGLRRAEERVAAAERELAEAQAAREAEKAEEERAEAWRTDLRHAASEVLNAKWSQPHACPICGTDSWQVSEPLDAHLRRQVPYAHVLLDGSELDYAALIA